MNILNALKQLRDDIKTWVTNNFNALNAKIDEKTIPTDSELDSTSTNPVQNQAISKEIDSINDRVGDTPVATQISQAINAQEHFSGDYNDLVNAPDISEDSSGNMIIADESGNIIFKADADGIHTTAVSLNGETAATEKYVDDAISKIPTPDVSGQINAHNTNGESHADIRQAIEEAKEELSESITSVSDKWEVADEAGNIIFRVDAEGTHTTNLTLDGEKAATLKDIEDAIGEIVIPEVPEVDYPDIEIKDDATIGAAEENFVNVYKNLTVDENNKHVLHEELVTIPKKEYVDEVADNLKEELSESIVAESDEWKVADEAGNIIFSVDATGAHTTELTLNGENAATESYVDNAIENIEFPKPDLTDYATKKYVDDAVDGIDFTGYATETYVDTKVADLVNSAPEALNTLGELATALEDHEDAYDALLETVGNKATHTDLENLRTELSESIVAETDEWKVVDENGNIIFSVDATGAHTTSMTLNGQSVEDMIDDKVDKVDGKGLSTNDFTNEYKEKLDGLENIIFKETDPTVPAWAKEANKPSYTADEVGALADTTVLADLTDDATHRTVTDAEKASWNEKSDFSGDYNDLTNAPDITEDNTGDLVIADTNGNIIFRSSDNGVETTNLIVENITINGMSLQEIVQVWVKQQIEWLIVN